MKSLIVKSTAVLLIIGGSLFTFSEEIFAETKNKCCSTFWACCECDGPCSAGLFGCECTGGSVSTN